MILVLPTFFFLVIEVTGNITAQSNHTSTSQSPNQTNEYYGHVVEESGEEDQGDVSLDEDGKSALHINGTETLNQTDEYYGNVWEHSGAYQGDILLDKDGISDRNIIRTGWWPYGIVPYVIAPYFSDAQVSTILRAMSVWENVLTPLGITDGSCQVKFVPRQYNHKNYLEITTAGPAVCNSNVGMTGGSQPLHLGEKCFEVATIVHELGHTLGLAHEQQRYDRDNYIRIIDKNRKPNTDHDFEPVSYQDYDTYGLPYDFKSIMHYSQYAFARRDYNGNPVGPTIVSLDPSVQITKNTQLSPIDMQKIKIMYCNNPMYQG